MDLDIESIKDAVASGDAEAVQAVLGPLVESQVASQLEEAKKPLVSNSAALKREKQQLAEKLKAYEGLDPDAAREALKKLEDARETELKDAGEFEKLKAGWEKRLSDETGKYKTEIEGLQDKLRVLQVDRVLIDKATKAGLNPVYMDLVVLEHKDRVDADEHGSLTFKDEKGEPLAVGQDEYFASYYRDKRPDLYLATGRNGGGAPAGSAAKPGEKTETFTGTPTERVKAWRRQNAPAA